MGKQKLLVIEDDPGLQKQLHWSFDGYEVLLAGEREMALALVRRHQPAVVTMDLGLPPDPDGATEGLATLQQILALAPDTKVIILSGNQERAHALKAIALGAYDFHQKSFDADMLGLVIARGFYLHAMQQENRRMLQTQADSPLAGIVSRDPGMLKLCRSVEKVAPSSASVMLLGDSGSGKELIARRFPKTCWKASSSAMSGGHLRARRGKPWARSSWPTAAPSFSTRSATCRWPCRRNCCDSCRKESSKGWAGAPRSPSTCASSAPRTRI